LIGVSRLDSAVAVVAKMRESGLPNYLLLAIVNKQGVVLRFKEIYDQSDVLI
jgi:hypothetical protein